MLQEQLQNGSTKTINGHECVDLGLSVCWATCNIGASLPKQCGGFFAWGETSSKNTFSEENYTYYSGTEERFGSQKKVIQGGDITSGKHDAAAVIWGGGWRMPTLKEWEELLKKCECKESSEGWEIVAGNHQSIFIPKVPAGNPPYDFTRYWTGNNVYTFERFVEDPYSGALAVSFKMPLSSANQKVWRGWPIRPVIDKSLFGEAIPQPATQKEEPKKEDEGTKLYRQIKEQIEKLSTKSFILGLGEDEGLEASNVIFDDRDLFEQSMYDFIPESRLYYIGGEYGQDHFAFVDGISLEDGELKFHIIKGTEDDNGTNYTDTDILSMDEINDEYSNLQDFNTLSMLRIWDELLRGEWFGEHLDWHVSDGSKNESLKKEEPITTSKFRDSVDGAINNAAVYVSYTSEEGEDCAYLYIVSDRKLYWVDENYNIAEPLEEKLMNSYIEDCKRSDYEEWDETIDAYDSIEDFLEAVGEAKKEAVEDEGECMSENGKYVVTLFVGDKKVCEKVVPSPKTEPKNAEGSELSHLCDQIKELMKKQNREQYILRIANVNSSDNEEYEAIEDEDVYYDYECETRLVSFDCGGYSRALQMAGVILENDDLKFYLIEVNMSDDGDDDQDLYIVDIDGLMEDGAWWSSGNSPEVEFDPERVLKTYVELLS